MRMFTNAKNFLDSRELRTQRFLFSIRTTFSADKRWLLALGARKHAATFFERRKYLSGPLHISRRLCNQKQLISVQRLTEPPPKSHFKVPVANFFPALFESKFVSYGTKEGALSEKKCAVRAETRGALKESVHLWPINLHFFEKRPRGPISTACI